MEVGIYTLSDLIFWKTSYPFSNPGHFLLASIFVFKINLTANFLIASEIVNTTLLLPSQPWDWLLLKRGVILVWGI